MSFNNQWIEIFRPGDYGSKGRYTVNDLDEIVRNFDPANWQPVLTPPAVQVGHADTAPALGLVSALRRDGERLLAQFEKVHPKLEEAVRDGRFPNRSVGIYRNPEGKGLMLRHVAFLGAVPPEVKGMAPVKFSDGEFVAIEFDDSPGNPGDKEEQVELKEVSKTVDERIRAFFSELFGKKPEAPAITEAQFSERVQAAVTAAMKPLSDQITALAEENKQLREGLAANSTAAALARFDERVAALEQTGKIVPALAGTIRLMRERVEQGGTVKFTEGQGEKAVVKEVPALDYILAELGRLPQIVPLGEVAGGKRRSPKGRTIQFTPGKGVDLDAGSVALSERADEIAAAEKIPFGDALRKARAEGAGNAIGSIAAGQV